MSLDHLAVAIFEKNKMIVAGEYVSYVVEDCSLIEKELGKDFREKVIKEYENALRNTLRNFELKITLIKSLIVPEWLGISQEEYTTLILKIHDQIDMNIDRLTEMKKGTMPRERIERLMWLARSI